MGEFPHQNIRVELEDMQEKGMPKQGIQIRSQAMLNVASVILKGIKTNETENLPSLFRSTSKKKKKKENKCNDMGKKLQRECKFIGKFTF